jgi:hypothetical protein
MFLKNKNSVSIKKTPLSLRKKNNHDRANNGFIFDLLYADNGSN